MIIDGTNSGDPNFIHAFTNITQVEASSLMMHQCIYIFYSDRYLECYRQWNFLLNLIEVKNSKPKV